MTVLAIALLQIAAGSGAATEVAVTAGTLKGCVTIPGQSSYRGVVSLWPAGPGKAPDPRRAIRPPIVSHPLQPDGCFSLQTAPGDYFAGAVVRRADGGWQGPPRSGDMVFLSPDADDKNLIVTIRSGETIDIGRHASGWQYAGFTPTASALTISGRLTTLDGKPKPGLLVFAFADSDMSKEPVAISEPSDANGRYLLRLPEPAAVYLRAREHYGRRSPADGGYMGIYGDKSPIAVIVGTDGDKQDRDLTIFLIPPLSERSKPMTESSPRQKNY